MDGSHTVIDIELQI